MGDIEWDRLGSEHESHGPYSTQGFYKEVDNVKEDVEQMEKLCSGAGSSAKNLMELRIQTNVDLDHVMKLARQINRKFDGLVRTNAVQSRLSGKGPGSTDDQARNSMISELGESLKDIMVRFLGLRVRTETDHR